MMADPVYSGCMLKRWCHLLRIVALSFFMLGKAFLSGFRIWQSKVTTLYGSWRPRCSGNLEFRPCLARDSLCAPNFLAPSFFRESSAWKQQQICGMALIWSKSSHIHAYLGGEGERRRRYHHPLCCRGINCKLRSQLSRKQGRSISKLFYPPF